MGEGPRIIVIGAGGAGLCAALAARERGAEVLLLAKATVGLANCTAYAGGGFTGPIEGLTPEEHMAMTREVGRGLSEPNMHRTVSEGAATAYAKLREWGVRYDTRRGGLSVSRYSMGGMLGGTGMTLPLRDRAQALGVQARAGHAVTAILRSDAGQGPVAGVELYDPATGAVSREAADGVIVATGGGGAAFPRSDNPARITGDGYRLLWDAGVELFDMEFVQWYPLGYAEQGFPVWMIGLPIVDQVPLENSDGERFYEKLLAQLSLRGGAEANLFARDRSAVAIAREWRAGREVFLRYDLVEPRDTIKQIDPLAAGRFGDPLAPRPVRVAPLVHYFCGGAVAAPDGVTSVPGLYACGEVVGGFDGANRMGGNALTAITVLSQMTGRRAAEDLKGPGQRRGRVGHSDAAAALACGGIAALAETWQANATDRLVAAPSGAALRQRIQRAVGEGLGVVRTADELDDCLASLGHSRALLPDLAPATAASRLAAVECLGMLLTAEVVAVAARMRSESRGGHFREDYPQEDPAWQEHIVLAPDGVAADALHPVGFAARRAKVGSVTPGAGA
jgi:succinate dehydrogenase/fumarate reductase flavoprotein subunit